MFRVLSLLFLFLVTGTCCTAQTPINLQELEGLRPIGKSTYYFRDPGSLPVSEILKPDIQSRFKPYGQDAPNFGSTTDAVWLRFSVDAGQSPDYYLQVGSPFIDSIALYAVNGNAVTHVTVSGDNYLFRQRPVKVNTFLFPLDDTSSSPQTFLLRTKTMQPFFFSLRIGRLEAFMEDAHKFDLIQGLYLGFMILIIIYNLFLFFSTREKIYLYYVAYVVSITWFMSTVFQYVFEFLWPGLPILNEYAVASTAITILTATLFTREFLQTSRVAPVLHKISWLFIFLGLLVFVLVLTPLKVPALMMAQAGVMLMAFYFLYTGITVYRKGYKPAKYYLVAWGALIVGLIAAILETVNVLPVSLYINYMQIGSAIEVTLLSLALGDRINHYKKESKAAQEEALRIAEEKAALVSEQNLILEQKVSERTTALSKSLQDLKDAQAQLIQSEKMASLGELTAGIAHEIQNPLNFVKNFSEINKELVAELRSQIENRNFEEVADISSDIESNEAKIMFHSSRAEGIVKGMLQHSRQAKGESEPTDINALCDEYLRLAYHGLRAKDKSFNANLKTDFDAGIGMVNVVPQDMGRVLLNLFNNAFYACADRSQKEDKQYSPTVSVETRQQDGRVMITVTDNGTGIPDSVKDKIFQPFFTTKPTGQGTGLGLSLSYDIVRAHKGEINLETAEDRGTTFVISLPAEEQ